MTFPIAKRGMTRTIAVLAASLAAVTLSVVPAGAGASIPVPDDDPFYDQPTTIAAATPGSILASRPVTVVAYAVPVPASAWQIKYASVDNTGRPTANVTTLIVPQQAWTGPGARPLLSYQTAEDGAGTQCAPSYGLRTGIAAGYGGLESGLMAMALARNWAVVVPDYEGPDSQFAGAKAEARGVLDSLKAVRRFAPVHLANSPIAMTGYSGGAVATAFAAQLQQAYAPHLPVKGVSLGGVVADFHATMMQFHALHLDGVVVMGLATVNRSYPAMHLTSVLNQHGRAVYQRVQRECIVQADMKYPLGGLDALTKRPDTLNLPWIVRFLARISPLGVGGVPAAPVYMYQADGDELAPIEPARRLFHAYCHAGATVEMTENPIGEHGTEAVAGFPAALDYLAARVAGQPAPSNC